VAWEGEGMRPITKMIEWRGGRIEFCNRDGLSLNSTQPAKPPWYVIQINGKWWSKSPSWYWWLDYAGPPEVYLTRKMAELRAKAFRRQYGGKPWGRGNGKLKVTVLKIGKELIGK